MSINPTDNNDNDWYSRFFNFGSGMRRTKRMLDWHRNLFEINPFKEFDYMEREMDSIFGQLQDIQNNVPKELIREYQTPEGATAREVGPIVYGYSMTIGPDGKPKVREFGNVKASGQLRVTNNSTTATKSSLQQISAEREPLVDVNTTDKEVKVILEMPGIRKTDIQIKAYDSKVEVTTSKDAQRKYHKTVDLPEQADIETARSVYNNGVLEITFDKKKANKPEGKEIKVE